MKTLNQFLLVVLVATAACSGPDSSPPGGSATKGHDALGASAPSTTARRLVRPSEDSTVASVGVTNAAVATDMATALDLPPSMVVSAQLTSPHAEAAKVLNSFGIIKPLRGGSLVVLSTGLINGGNKHLPEPGTDFARPGVDDDAVTLRLTLNVPHGANRLFFNYNFLSAESPEFVGTTYNDQFTLKITEAATPQVVKLASIDSASFIDASETNAQGTGFELLFADDPAGADSFPAAYPTGVQIFPDSGLTGFQTASLPLSGVGGQITLEFDLRDVEDGFLDSTVVIDNLSVSCLEVVDPDAIENELDLIDSTGTITGDPAELAVKGETVRAVAADGATRVLLRAQVPGPGKMKFFLPNLRPTEKGGLSRIGGAGWSDSVEVEAQAIAGLYYVFALYQSPEDFLALNDGEYMKSRERPVNLSFEYTPTPDSANPGTGFAGIKAITIVRPPVVVVHDIWSNCLYWRTAADIYVKNENNFLSLYCAEYGSTNSNSLSSAQNRSAPIDTVNLALDGTRGRGSKETRSHETAVSRVDVIAHGAGGLLVRRFVEEKYVNRLITLNTPHGGSRLASAIVSMRETVKSIEPDRMDKINDILRELGMAIDGPSPMAIDDLQRTSPFMGGVQEFHVPSHVMLGRGGLGGVDRDAGYSMVDPKRPLYSNLERFYSVENYGRLDMDMVFGAKSKLLPEEHDLFLTETEQQGRLATGATTALLLAPKDKDAEHFKVPSSDNYYAHLVALLNSPVHGGAFAAYMPKPLLPRAARDQPVTFAAQAGESQARTLRATPGGLRIVSPLEGTSVSPDGTVTVVVEAWGGFIPEELFVIGAGQAVYFDAPFHSVEFKIPKEAMGTVKLTAFGIDFDGTMISSEPVLLSVASSAKLTSMSVLNGDAFLRGPGEMLQLRVYGHYNDGVTRDLTAAELGSIYSSSSSRVVTVTRDGRITGIGPGTATITIRNGTVFTSISATVRAREVDPCIKVRLGQYNLFVLEDYLQGHHVEGRVAAGGNISLQDFSVGSALSETDIAHGLTAGGNMTLASGSVWETSGMADSSPSTTPSASGAAPRPRAPRSTSPIERMSCGRSP
ncbi:choice-of-anchor A family protein [Cystobacter fuscus]